MLSSGGSGINAARGAGGATLVAGRSTRGGLMKGGTFSGVRLVPSTNPLSTSKSRADRSLLTTLCTLSVCVMTASPSRLFCTALSSVQRSMLLNVIGGNAAKSCATKVGTFSPSSSRNLYIYNTIAGLSPKAILTNLCSKFDEFIAVPPDSRRFLCAYMLSIRDLCATAFCVCPLFFTTKNHKINNVAFRHILRCLLCSFRIDVATALRQIRVIARWRNDRCRDECGNVEGSEGRCKRPSGVRGGAREQTICE